MLRHDDAESLAADIASRLLARLEEAQDRGEVPHVGLTGGSIADAVHREVARRAADSSLDWSRVVFWWGDERFVETGSPERNARQARSALLDHVPVDPAHVHEVPGSDRVPSVEDAAAAYAETVRAEGAGEFTVLMLGVGPDGHVASLFPGHPATLQGEAVTVAVHDSPKPPPERVSLTMEALGRSRAVWFLVSGAEKADAVARALAPEGSTSQTPARGVLGREETLWLLDDAAAAGLG